MVLLECILIELPNIGGAIAPPAPPVPAPLLTLQMIKFCFCRTNAVTMPRLRENLGDPLGHSLFPNFSIFAHDCMANCRYTVSKDGKSVTVRALRHIKEGENLSITYTNPLLGNQVGGIHNLRLQILTYF